MANFEAFLQTIKLSINLLFLKSDMQLISAWYFSKKKNYMKISASCWQDQNIITINEFWKYSYGIFKSGLISYVVSIQIISEKKWQMSQWARKIKKVQAKKNSWNQIVNQFHEILLKNQNHFFFAISKMVKNQFINWEKV